MFCHARGRLGASPSSDVPAASLPPEQDERAAALLVDLWAAAARHGIARDQSGCTVHRNLRICERERRDASPFLLHRRQVHHAVAGLASAARSTGASSPQGAPGDPFQAVDTKLLQVPRGVEVPSSTSPHPWQQNTRTPSGSAALTSPHPEQRLLDGYQRGATSSRDPYQAVL